MFFFKYILIVNWCWDLGYVSHEQIPTNPAGLIEYRAHPFWIQKYCPSHEYDGTPRCCSCERMEVSGISLRACLRVIWKWSNLPLLWNMYLLIQVSLIFCFYTFKCDFHIIKIDFKWHFGVLLNMSKVTF